MRDQAEVEAVRQVNRAMLLVLVMMLLFWCAVAAAVLRWMAPA